MLNIKLFQLDRSLSNKSVATAHIVETFLYFYHSNVRVDVLLISKSYCLDLPNPFTLLTLL